MYKWTVAVHRFSKTDYDVVELGIFLYQVLDYLNTLKNGKF